MLDRTKLIHTINKLAPHLFPDSSGIAQIAFQKWEEIIKDPLFIHKAQEAKSSFLIPEWKGELGAITDVSGEIPPYTVLAVDGSQIYPDRHVSGAACFLINTGGIFLTYGANTNAQFFSEPSVFIPSDIAKDDITEGFSVELVDLKRGEFEFEMAQKKMAYLLAHPEKFERNAMCFVDGTLIFWPLEGKTQEIKSYFLTAYLSYLDYFYQQRIPIAGYISFPKSKELINLIKLSLCRFSVANCIPCHSTYTTFPCKVVDNLVDTSIMHHFLPELHRTTLFASCSKIVDLYPARLKPYFFYLNVGKEIARIEIPAWIADDEKALDLVCKVAIDQSTKGQGYPVCLAESHEQAVVKGGDRDFYFHLIYKVGVEQNRRMHYSQKSIKKRTMGI